MNARVDLVTMGDTNWMSTSQWADHKRLMGGDGGLGLSPGTEYASQILPTGPLLHNVG